MATAGVLSVDQSFFCDAIVEGVVAGTGGSVAVGATHML